MERFGTDSMLKKKLASMSPTAQAAVVAFILFFVWNVCLIVKYNGLYDFDEMYHISSSDAHFHSISEYARAPYLNWLIRILSAVFGRNYYVYKSVPLVLSLISIGSLLYLSARMFRHRYNILLLTLLCAGHCVLACNHLYIRMYVWDEAAISLLALIFYRLAHTDSRRRKICLHILYFAVAAGLYIMQPDESSSKAVMLVGIAAWCANYIGVKLVLFLDSKRLITPVICLLELLIFGIEYMLFPLRLKIVPNSPILAPLSTVIRNLGRLHSVVTVEAPVFTLYFATQSLLLSVGLLGCGYLLVKGKYKEDNRTGIYILALLPFIAYNMLYFDQSMFRVYAAYLPVLIFATVLWLDHFDDTRIYRCVSLAATALTVLMSAPGYMQNPFKNFISFYECPNIYHENVFNDYGGMIEQAKSDIAAGRKCISLWPNMHQQAAFELNDEYTLAFEGSINDWLGYTKEDIEPLLSYLARTEEPYVLLVSYHADSRLNRLDPNILDSLLESYPYKTYGIDRPAYLFYIN